MATPSLPAPTTSPLEIREYISQLLITQHSAHPDEAQKIAAKWRFGRGSELLSFSAQTYGEIFGAEAGAILHAHASGKHGEKISERGESFKSS